MLLRSIECREALVNSLRTSLAEQEQAAESHANICSGHSAAHAFLRTRRRCFLQGCFVSAQRFSRNNNKEQKNTSKSNKLPASIVRERAEKKPATHSGVATVCAQSTMGIRGSKILQSENNIEASTLIWLDDTVNKLQETIDAQQQLALVLRLFKAFADESACENYIRSLSGDDRAILIVSGKLGQKFVPRIESCKQIVAIYVYCGDKQRHQWTTQFPKVISEERLLTLRTVACRCRSEI
jgi:hypothetical protein